MAIVEEHGKVLREPRLEDNTSNGGVVVRGKEGEGECEGEQGGGGGGGGGEGGRWRIRVDSFQRRRVRTTTMRSTWW